MAIPPHSCVVIHSASEDEHGKAVSLNLKAKGIPFILLAQDRCFCDWSIEDRHGEVVIRSEDRVLSTEDIGIVYWRQDYQCTSDTVFARCGGDAGIAAFIAEQRERHVYGCWNTLQRYVPFMNGLDANRRAQSKIYQQHMASQIGLRVPLTYTGAQPKEAEAFAQQLWEQGKRCCTKNIESTRIVINGKPHARYTQLFTPADVCQLDALSACPMIFQEYAEKKWEYRVTVVGDKVFPCKIESQLAGGRTAIDWRHYDIPKTPHRACTISDTLTAKLVKLVRELGLSFGACDLIHTLTDDVLFLEINSLGSWLWIEDLAGLPITDSVAAQIAHMRQGN